MFTGSPPKNEHRAHDPCVFPTCLLLLVSPTWLRPQRRSRLDWVRSFVLPEEPVRAVGPARQVAPPDLFWFDQVWIFVFLKFLYLCFWTQERLGTNTTKRFCFVCFHAFVFAVYLSFLFFLVLLLGYYNTIRKQRQINSDKIYIRGKMHIVTKT